MLRRRVLTSLAVIIGLLAPIAGGAGTATGADPATEGLWNAPFAEDPDFADHAPATIEESLRTPPAVSMVVLPDGRVLYWGGLEGLEDSAAPLALDAGRSAKLSRARLLDLRDGTPSWSVPTPEFGGTDDMFCADQRILADGTVVVAGGTIYTSDPVDLSPITGEEGPGGTAELFGSSETRVFDPDTDEFTDADPMNHGRWYPTLLTLPDGRLFVASGVGRLIYNTEGVNVAATEIYDPSNGSWTDNGEDGAATLPLFARLHLLPDGEVFYDGSGQMWSPFGQSVDEVLWNFQRSYDPVANEWSIDGIGNFGARSGTMSVMLPLRPDESGEYAEQAEIVVAGGVLGMSPGTFVSTAITEIVTAGGGEASSERVADLNNARWYSSGVLLPDGTVLAVSGADKDEVIAPGSEQAVHQAELYDPEADTWTALSLGERDRTYHNAAVLLPDASVLVGGHSPINNGYGPTGDNTFHDLGLAANNFKDPSFEVFEPPYLHSGDRPSVIQAPAGVGYDSTFEVTVEGNDSVDELVFVRLPSTTHVTDADMRGVEVPFRVKDQGLGADTLEVIAPPDGNVAPPGFYYLFALKDGVPSKAHVVRVASDGLPGFAEAPMGI